jgi:uncharacterized membrane protein YbhN (UPF0104 family)
MKLKFLLRLTGPLIFIILVYFYVDLREFKKIIFAIHWPLFVLSAAITPVLVYIRSLRWWIILTGYGMAYSSWQCFKIYFVEMVVIMVVATVGTLAKVIYLKRDGYGLLQPILTVLTDKYYDYLLPLILALPVFCWYG